MKLDKGTTKVMGVKFMDVKTKEQTYDEIVKERQLVSVEDLIKSYRAKMKK